MKPNQHVRVDVVEMIKAICLDLDLNESTCSYLIKRYECEGIKFLTVTLPKLGKSVLRSIEHGFFDRSDLTCFRWKGRALANFRELTDSVFDSCGVLRSDASAVEIYRLRQLSDYFYKLALEFSDEQIVAAEKNFVAIDGSLPGSHDAIFVNDLRKAIETNYSFATLEEVLANNRPRFGPGTYAGKAENFPKIPFYEVKQSSEVYNLPQKFAGISGYFRSYPSDPSSISFGPDTSDCSELLFVAKDSRGPRTIVREPLHKLSVQMAFFDYMSDALQKQTRNRINFSDQSINRRLAAIGSKTGEWCTIDLKDASDSVSIEVVRIITRNIPMLRFFINTRSTHCRLPSGGLIELNKLAGMGSGLTFAFLAFLVHSSVTLAISQATGLSFSNCARDVYVYGDDLICKTRFAEIAFSALSRCGLKVNTGKSFTATELIRPGQKRKPLFRESCGGDYFDGNDVGTVKLRLANCNPSIKNHCIVAEGFEGLNQIAKHAKELSRNGMLACAEVHYRAIEKIVGGLPLINNFSSSVIGRYTHDFVRYTPNAVGQYPLIRVLTTTPIVDEECFLEHPYVRLGRALSQGDPDTCPHLSSENTPVLPRYHIAVPRKLRLRRVRISTLSLQR